MKILNLYAGIGGNRRLWGDKHAITSVEIEEKRVEIYKDFYPNDVVIVADAHQYLLDHYKEFDFIWSSPPCPTHSHVNHFLNAQGCIRYPDMGLYQEIIFLKTFFKGKYCVENVKPYYDLLIPAKQIERHIFWTNFNIGNFTLGKKISVTNSKGETRRSWSEHIKELSDYHDIDLSKYKQHGKHGHYKLLANCVNPKLGKYILDCAEGIINKSNTKQLDIFTQ